MKFYPYEKGEVAVKSFNNAEGRYKRFWGSFYVLG